MGAYKRSHKKIEYLVKDLKLRPQLAINRALNKLNPMIIDALEERDIDYKSFKVMYKLEDVNPLIDLYRERFQAVNDLMIKNNLKPVFQCDEESDPYLLNSCYEYHMLTMERAVEELNEELNTRSFAEYHPEPYYPETSE